MNKIIVKCGDEVAPNFWGFTFDNVKDASQFAGLTCFGRTGFRTLSTDEDVKYLVDCCGCKEVGFGCCSCNKPIDLLESDGIEVDREEML